MKKTTTKRRKYRLRRTSGVKQFCFVVDSICKSIFYMVSRAFVLAAVSGIVLFIVAGSRLSWEFAPKQAIDKVDAADRVLSVVRLAKNWLVTF